MNSSGRSTVEPRRHRIRASVPTQRLFLREQVGRYSRKNSPLANPSWIALSSIMSPLLKLERRRGWSPASSPSSLLPFTFGPQHTQVARMFLFKLNQKLNGNLND